MIVVDGLAASGGYIAALGSDHIVAGETSLVGSIGVLFQYPNFGEALKSLGIKMEEIKSSPLKAAPNGFEPTSPEARAAVESIVMDSYAWFRNLVKDRRQLDDADLEKVADGRVFTGRQGLGLKLVDELGDERTAVAWLAREKNIDPKTPVRDFRLRDRFSDLLPLLLAISLLLRGRTDCQRRKTGDAFLNGTFEFVVEVLEAFGAYVGECFLRCTIEDKFSTHQDDQLVKELHILHRVGCQDHGAS